MRLFKTLTRILAIVGKELVSIVRRPGALVSLVLGPFLIMALFGLGYSGFRRPLDTIVVIPDGSGLPTDVKSYQDVAGEGLQIRAVTPDEVSAMADLAAQRVDVVVVAPKDIQANFKAGKRTQVEVRVNKAGCFSQCGHGPMIVVYPENVWYAGVQESDLPEMRAPPLAM